MAEDDRSFVDHYAVLGLPSSEEGTKISLEEIKKAYRNQSRIRHPDKRPNDPKATADFQFLTTSFEVLSNETTRSCFDAKLRTRRERVLRDSFQNAKRRKMATDLEQRERTVAVDPAEEVRRKEKMKADELKREIAEFKARRMKKAFEPQNRKENVEGGKKDSSLDKGRMLKVIWETSAGDYSAAKLREIFERFGIVEDVVIRTNSVKKKASAIIVMASKGATVRAIQSMSGGTTNPLLVLPLEPIAPSFSSSSSTNQNESMGPEFNNVVGAGFQNYEEFVMKKLQEAYEKNKCV
ncbi:dnaJ homolog subfamily C member 17-like [Dendrobium catenatum]|uniref:dnaJ homolog subfamily C member 17-like n=1 Tax=Dendrobium catenatum TaxID=906689 RepID=UPI00109F2EA9|nr:dnaJ homolog subfamily C member 17-like [Dendrobium catenatum]XP_028550611.1 dnaJ homolog subfamily C member 17-like [Dendrobium catenatum]